MEYLCFDIGGTTIKYGLLDERANITYKNEEPTEAKEGAEHLYNKLVTLIGQLKSSHDIRGIGISTAGIVDANKGEILYASDTFPGYTGMHLKERLEQEFNLPVAVENDVNCAALAEAGFIRTFVQPELW